MHFEKKICIRTVVSKKEEKVRFPQKPKDRFFDKSSPFGREVTISLKGKKGLSFTFIYLLLQ